MTRPCHKIYMDRIHQEQKSAKPNITNRPWLTTPERLCAGCDSPYRAAWGWVYLADGSVIDLDGHCARRLRYCGEDERIKFIAAIVRRGLFV